MNTNSTGKYAEWQVIIDAEDDPADEAPETDPENEQIELN